MYSREPRPIAPVLINKSHFGWDQSPQGARKMTAVAPNQLAFHQSVSYLSQHFAH